MVGTVLVRVAQGTLRGRKLATDDGVTYYSFQGVPYAKPPVGQLRFKPPQPLEPWTGVRDALALGNVAPHFDPFKEKLVGDEDCLFLNVYTPQINPIKPFPVMVWIHGGGFMWGSGNTDIYGPQPLIREGVILVTLNYRLGVLGFFSAPGTSVTSNNGLRDQAAALKWVQKNIVHFGGDPNNVTIFGESAGSFSVHFQVLSPQTKGLFHKAIAMSGSALCNHALLYPDVFEFGREAGYKGDDLKGLAEYLRRLSFEDINAASARSLKNLRSYYGPVVEEPGPNAFVVDHPLKLIRSGNFNRVPLMAGVTSSEGKLYYISPVCKVPVNELNDVFETMLPPNFKLEAGSEKSKRITEKFKKFYFGDQGICEETLEKLKEFLGDSIILYGTHEAVKEHTNVNSPVFYYMFSFEGKFSFTSLAGKESPGPGAAHGDELFYLFQSDEVENNHKPGTPEHEISTKIVKLWTNFAKYGNPSKGLDVEWPQTSKEDLCYLNIDTELSLCHDLYKERIEFWENIYKEIFDDR